jgi:hypothetical protein
MNQRELDVIITADGKTVKNVDVFNTYFSELGNTGELLEDAVENHLKTQGVTPTRRLNTQDAQYDVGIKVKEEVYIPPLETEPINGKKFKVTFKYRPVGGRRRRTVKRRRRSTRGKMLKSRRTRSRSLNYRK